MVDLGKIERYVDSNLGNFGVNKKGEIVRLVYEIAKREKVSFSKIIKGLRNKHFSSIKKQLLTRRYPYGHLEEKNLKLYLPRLKVNPEYKVRIKRLNLYPENIYVEEGIKDSCLASRLKTLFPKANFKKIDSLKDYLKCKAFTPLHPESLGLQTEDKWENRFKHSENAPAFRPGVTGFTIKDYNQRAGNFFIVKERYDFLKRCPCSQGALSCNYHIFNLGLGCIYECVYCFLQEYQNSPGIIIPVNLADFFTKVKFYLSHRPLRVSNFLRLGSGEFTDSLALDEITEFSPQIIHFFKDHPKIFFEFKTKSKNIKNIVKSKPQKNIIISWSLSPQKVVEENEFYTATLEERISSALACLKAGFKVGFHLDPILYYEGWLQDYLEMINYLFDKIKEERIAWISLGTLRFNPALKKIIENRFPENKILDEELILGFDGKMRYPQKLRITIYKKMLHGVRKRSKKFLVYLCMEEKKIWKEIF